jgi:hypothetical protein
MTEIPGLPPQRPVQPADRLGQKVRCFVTKIEASAPTRNLYESIVHYTADHASGTFYGAFYTADGRAYEIGEVLWVTVNDE